MPEDPGVKFRRLTDTAPIIIPVDFEIIHNKNNCVWVQATGRVKPADVIEYVKGLRGGNWIISIWRDEGKVIENPCRNDRGWMWKLELGD